MGRNGRLLVNGLLMRRAAKLHGVIGRRPFGSILFVEQQKDIKTYTLSYMVALYVQLVFAKHNVTTLSLRGFVLVETEFLF